MTAAWILFGAYAAVTVVLAALGSRKTGTLREFALGRGDISPWVVGLALAASTTSTATFLINPGIVWAYGVSALLGYGLAAGLGLMAGLVVLSKGFRRHGLHEEVLTVPSWLGRRYGSRAVRVFFALVSLLLLAMAVLITYALAALAVIVLDLGTLLGAAAFPVALGGIIAFVYTYTLFGGTYAHAYTNTLQGGVMLAAAVALLASGLGTLGPGFLERLAAIDPMLATATNPSSLLFRNLFEVFGANLIIGFALACQPHFVVKALYVDSDRAVNRYLGVAIAAGTVFLGLLACGLFARLRFGDEIAAALAGSGLGIDGVMPTYIALAFPPVLASLIAVAILAAGMSTLDGLLVALSAILAADVYMPLAGRDDEETRRRAFRFGRGALVVGGIVTFVLGMLQHAGKELSIAIFAQDGVYGLLVATCLPVLFGLFPGRRPSPGLVLASSATALVVHFGMRRGRLTLLTEADWTNPGLTATWALLAAAAVLVVGMMVERRRAP